MHSLASYFSPFCSLPSVGDKENDDEFRFEPMHPSDDDGGGDVYHSGYFTVLSVEIISEISSHMTVSEIVNLAKTNKWMHHAVVRSSAFGTRALPAMRRLASHVPPRSTDVYAALRCIKKMIPEMQPALLRFVAQKAYRFFARGPDDNVDQWRSIFHAVRKTLSLSPDCVRNGKGQCDLLIAEWYVFMAGDTYPASQDQVERCMEAMRMLASEHWPDIFYAVMKRGGTLPTQELSAFIRNSDHYFIPPSFSTSVQLVDAIREIDESWLFDDTKIRRLGVVPEVVGIRGVERKFKILYFIILLYIVVFSFSVQDES